MDKLNIIFFVSSKLSLVYIEKIINIDYINILCIVTKKSINKNNNIKLVEYFCIKNNIKLLQPISFNNKFICIIKEFKPDLMVIISYGKILTKELIDIPKFGCINLHYSILPRWRGPAPIYWSILSGDKKTGITIFELNSKIDQGNIILQKEIFINNKDTYISLQNKLNKLGYKSLIYILNKYLKNEFIYKKAQNNKNYLYARKINKKYDTKINWNKSSLQINRCVRAYNLWPGSYFIYKNKIIKVWESDILSLKKENKYKVGEILFIDKNGIGINTGCGILIIKKIQFENKNKIYIKDYINSNKIIFKISDLIL